jgi:hypothetical protein
MHRQMPFIQANVRHFAYTDKEQALEWLRS